jgi:hypothetical protein
MKYLRVERRPADQNKRHCRSDTFVLIACVGIEVVMIVWLSLLGRDAFMTYAWAVDTQGYVAVALHLVETGTLTAGPRTLGYPLFVAFAYFLGGVTRGPYVVIGLQLVLNVGLTWGCWRLLERMAPTAGVRIRALATLFFSWAALGMALILMSDFLGAVFFGMFLYGMLFWRSRTGVALCGGSLAFATLTRPTFTFFPLVIPFLAWLVGRCTAKLSRRDLIFYMGCSLAATGLSVMYQYSYSRYMGPSPNLITPIQETIYHGVVERQAPSSDIDSFKKQFEQEVEKRAGRTYSTLSPTEREMYAKSIFREEFAAHPTEIMANFVSNFIKYIFVPVEFNVNRLTAMYFGDKAYFDYLRPILGLICLPLWILSLIPPIGAPKSHKMFYLIVTTCLLYIVGLSAIGSGAGERYRFPVLMFMLPVVLWNLQWLISCWPPSLGRHSIRRDY